MKPYYITTAILYPNADPHMGHALELVQADFLARYHRGLGEEVRFQTGTDEHGLKMQRAAEKAGKENRVFADEQIKLIQNFVAKLDITCDRLIRTTDEDHVAMAQALWRACAARGDIYKKTYRAWYNVKQEEFLALVEDVPDPAKFEVDPQFIEMIEEENYFFAASKYNDQVCALIEKDEYQLFPANRKLEILNFVKSKGMQDISISRDKSKLSWGIPVPDDDSQVMYVWFDALTNYLTGAGAVVEGKIVPDTFWPADLHCVGKDISRFHALLWPAMLLSAGIAVPKSLLVHGFVLANGHVMSKSLGNVVDPMEAVSKYGVDAVRWFLLRAIPTSGDGEFTWDRLGEVYASDLANDYGNLVSRVLAMAQKYCGGVPKVTQDQVDNLEKVLVEEKWREYHEAISRYEIDKALGAAHQLVVFCNRRIEELKPWVLAKEGAQDDLNELLYELLEIIRHITLMFVPVMPAITAKVQSEILLNSSVKRDWGELQPGAALGTGAIILFPRIES